MKKIIILLFAAACILSAAGEKMPVTSASPDAVEAFGRGQDLYEKLRLQESIQYFENAVSSDPQFSLAYLHLAFTATSQKAFFEYMDKAESTMDQASRGEQLWILGTMAGVNNDIPGQLAAFQEMAEMYPEDERAQNVLGNFYFGQQEFALAITAYEKAIANNPEIPQPYNQKGYAHRFLGDYKQAEIAFKKYIELIPDDPNPYDSYAELLLKMGKYEEAISSYEQALNIKPDFVNSFVGIGTCYTFLGKHKKARKELDKLLKAAHNDGERRLAHFSLAVSYVDEGRIEDAISELEANYALAEGINDAGAMAVDLINMGTIQLAVGRYDQAMQSFSQAEQVITKSELAREIKDNARQNYLFNASQVAIKLGNVALARSQAFVFLKQVEQQQNPLQIMQGHALSGLVALEESMYDMAIDELLKANMQNPRNLFRLAQAYQGKGDLELARDYCRRVVEFNALNNLNYALCRQEAIALEKELQK